MMKRLFREWGKGWLAFLLAYSVVLPLWFLIELADTLEKQRLLPEPWNTAVDWGVFLTIIFVYPFFALNWWRAWLKGGTPHRLITSMLSQDGSTDAQANSDATEST